MAKKKRTTIADAAACPEGLNMPRPTREEHTATVLQQIAAFEERLEGLETDMESSGWDDIGDYRGRLDDLRARLKALSSRAEELEAVSDKAWPAANKEMEESLVDVAEGIDDLVAGLSLVLPE